VFAIQREVGKGRKKGDETESGPQYSDTASGHRGNELYVELAGARSTSTQPSYLLRKSRGWKLHMDPDSLFTMPVTQYTTAGIQKAPSGWNFRRTNVLHNYDDESRSVTENWRNDRHPCNA